LLRTLKKYKLAHVSIQLLVFLIVCFLFYKQIQHLSWKDFSSLKITHFSSLIFAVLLVFLNWLFEFAKWKEVLRTAEINSTSKKTRNSFLAGIISGFLTPNMLGNFIGRMYYFHRKDRLKIIVLTLFSNAAQFLVSFGFGLVSILLIGLPSTHLNLPQYVLFGIIVGVLILALLVYFKLENIQFLSRKFNIKRIIVQLKANPLFRFKLLFLSAFRYLVFSIQFWLVIDAFGLQADWECFLWIWQIFFWSTLAPSLWFGKIMIRESMAIWILGTWSGNPSAILLSSLILWLLNQGIPAIIGIPYLKKHQA
jgi:hypothetical protein